MHAARILPILPISRFPDFECVAHRLARLGLATATATLAARRLAHEHARAEHARHARTMRARLASRAHALTWQHTRSRQKLDA